VDTYTVIFNIKRIEKIMNDDYPYDCVKCIYEKEYEDICEAYGCCLFIAFEALKNWGINTDNLKRLKEAGLM
jgi:hypothetical protein